MNYKVELGENFKREFKALHKKYRSLASDLEGLIEILEEDPTFGTHLGNNVYKIRLSIASLKKGKSGGSRVLSLVKVSQTTVLLLSIYTKGEKDTILDQEIARLVKEYL